MSDGGIFGSQNDLSSRRRGSEMEDDDEVQPPRSSSGNAENAMLIGGAILAGIATIAGIFLGRKKP